MSRPIWYLAHPVSPDARFTFEQNMAHALVVARIADDVGFKVCLPWYADCLYHDDSNASHRADGLAMDVEIARLVGRIMLVGHRISSGMQAELAAVMAAGGTVLRAVGVPDQQLGRFLQWAAPPPPPPQ